MPSSSLLAPPAANVIDRLFGASETDDAAFAAFRAAHAGFVPRELPAARLAELTGDIYMPVSRETGVFLYQLVRAVRPRLVVEFGTSFGIAAVHLAAAVRDNGAGRVVSTELSPSKVAAARANLAEAGLSDVAEVWPGDALETLATLPGQVDFLLLDGWNHLYLPVLNLIEPGLSKGAVVVADDTVLFADDTADYLAYVRDPAHGYISSPLPIDDGLELSTRL
ncbi:methyltransferase [Frankia sp. CcI49]|uniref:O-methyltransferase n=1 Tax=Frankia sp. CcI49 TaxID=1745382 RepID=UPI00097861FF|nr:class I SAM-dependent methyltransferase [Frankia sp. CcI49]ONH58454.1 methyltransferase [Frankia sp. CcI49]